MWAEPMSPSRNFGSSCITRSAQDLRKAKEAAERYRTDPDTDFHAARRAIGPGSSGSRRRTSTSPRHSALVCEKFAAMIGKPEREARAIYDRYDRELPFVRQLAERCQSAAAKQGYLELYDGARRHWDAWEAPEIAWTKGTGPCSREEAERRVRDPNHPWYRRRLRRAETHKAMNALIQGSAARHTKLWMRACWREGIVPLLQMHDALGLLGGVAEQARAGRAAGPRGGRRSKCRCGRPQVWPELGRCQTYVGGAHRGRTCTQAEARTRA